MATVAPGAPVDRYQLPMTGNQAHPGNQAGYQGPPGNQDGYQGPPGNQDGYQAPLGNQAPIASNQAHPGNQAPPGYNTSPHPGKCTVLT